MLDLDSAQSREGTFSRIARRLTWRAAGLDEVDRLHDRLVVSESDVSPFDAMLRLLDVTVNVCDEDVRRIPADGPLVIVANHPIGGPEGIALGSLVRRVRPDVKILANYILEAIPELRDLIIPVDPFDARSPRNARGLRAAVEHLRSGGALVTFPAGVVSHFQPKRLSVSDPPWSISVARLSMRTHARVLPVWIRGNFDLLFEGAGLVHPRLRTALLPRRLLKLRGSALEIRVGQPIGSSRCLTTGSPAELTRLMRFRTYALAQRHVPTPGSARSKGYSRPIISPVDPALLEAEITRLPATARMTSQGDMEVYIAAASQIPETLTEIGRLRELTFRGVGEGTGNAADLDRFDSWYAHLFIWNRAKQELVGAYRLCTVDPGDRRAAKRLYTATLFRYSPGFFSAFETGAIELGRSFVREEYQRSFAPLMLLWKGIGTFVARNPRYSTLFGPVSISRDYGAGSRLLIARYLMQKRRDLRLARCVRPRLPFRTGFDAELDDLPISTPEELSEVVASLEADGRGIPVLLRQYLKLGGNILHLNVDPDFSDVVDALVVIDLRRTDQRTLAKYLGADGLAAFNRASGVDAA